MSDAPAATPPRLPAFQVQVPDDLIRGRVCDLASLAFVTKPFGAELHLWFGAHAGLVPAAAAGAAPESGVPLPGQVARVALYPETAKRFAGAMGQNVTRYEARFGAPDPGALPGLPEGPLGEGSGALPPLYGNVVMVNHRPGEFLIDFLYSPPGAPFARVVHRAILPPRLARALADAVTRAVAAFEAREGAITLTPPPGTPTVH